MMRIILCSIGLLSALIVASAQSFTYQGFLKEGGNPASGTFNMTFRLFDVPTGGTALATIGPASVSVSNGLFTVELNYPASVWTGANRWLEIQVGSTTLSPRVKITRTPYAIYSANTRGLNVDTNLNVGLTNIRRFIGLNPSDSFSYDGKAMGHYAVGWFDDSWNGGGATAWFSGYAGIKLFTNGTPRLAITNVGNVGVGTTSPTFLLDILGNQNRRLLNIVNLNPNSSGDGIWVQTSGTGAFGVYSICQGTGGIALYGYASASTGTPVGVYGRSSSADGHGGYFDGRVSINYNSNTTNATLRLHETEGDFARLEFTNTNTARKWYMRGFIGGSAETDQLNFGNSLTGDIINMSGDGRVGIGANADPRALLFVRTNSIGYAIFSRHSATTGTTYSIIGINESPSGVGVIGWANATSGTNYGVQGFSSSASGYGVFSGGRFAASGTKSFQIDHPLRPETHYLNHFCTEAPEPQNIYNGVVVLDTRGEAWVQLPDYFEAINRDPRYTLTPIGAPMPNLHIAQEVQGNRFKIAGGVPGARVSWEVKAIRNDRWVQEYGYQTEQEKPKEHQGKYLHPELYGQPKEKGVHYHPEPERPKAEPVRPNQQ